MAISTFLYGLLGVMILFILFNRFDRSNPYVGGGIRINPFPFQLRNEHRRILENYFTFYKNLDAPSKKLFESKLARFIRAKTFIPRKMPKVTAEMKVCISASAIQLTFYLPDVYLNHFRYILVYPDEYYSVITRKFHKGEVNPRHQAIVLSWKAYVEGFAANEGINLGLHEMAHALHLENTIRNEEFDFLPKEELRTWDRMAADEINKINQGGHPFFRLYGGVDTFEFFAVAVENFFERPQAFQDYNSKLYYVLSRILNQNPSNMV